MNTRSSSSTPDNNMSQKSETLFGDVKFERNVEEEKELNVSSLTVKANNANIESTTMNASASALSNVKRFRNSRSGDAASFILKFEKSMTVGKVKDDNLKIHWFGTRLIGEGQEWFEDWYENDTLESWDICKNDFLSVFKRKVDRSVDIMVELAQIRQATWKDETVEAYGIRIRRLFNEFNKQPEVVTLSEKQKVSYFVRGLNPDLIEFVKIKFATREGYTNDVTFSQVMEFAQFTEENARLSHQGIERNSEIEEGQKDEVEHVHHIGAIKLNQTGAGVTQQTRRKGRTLFEVDRDLNDLKKMVGSMQEDFKVQKKHNETMEDFAITIKTAIRNLIDSQKQLTSSLEYCRNGVQCSGVSQEDVIEEQKKVSPWPSKTKVIYKNKSYSSPPICYACGIEGHIAPRCQSSEEMKKNYRDTHPQFFKNQNFHSVPFVNVGMIDDKSDSSELISSNSVSLRKVMLHPDRVLNIRSGEIDKSKTTKEEIGNVNIQTINKTACLKGTDVCSNLLTANGKAFGVEMKAIMIDTGASVSCLSFDIFNKFPREVKANLRKLSDSKQLTTATGEPMNSIGEIELEITLKGVNQPVKLNLSCVVVKHLNSECLLGANVFDDRKMKEYIVNLQEKTLTFVDIRGVQEIIQLNTGGTRECDVTGKYAVYLVNDVFVPAQSVINVHSQACSTELPNPGIILFETSNCFRNLPIEIETQDSLFTVEDNTISQCVPFLVSNSGDIPFLLKKGQLVGHCIQIEEPSLEEKLSAESVSSVQVQQVFTGEERVKQYDFLRCVNANEQEVSRLKRMLQENSSIFEDRPQGSTAVDLMEQAIELIDSNVKPVKQYAYRTNPETGRKQKEFIQEMLEAGVIYPSHSSWASPVLCVPKANGELRFCTDFRKVNKLIKSDVFPLPRIDDLLDKMSGCRYFSTLDLKSAFWQIPIEKKSRHLTAFVCQGQLYEYAKTPFGLKTSPAVFQRNMELVINGASDYASAYLDDLIIYSKTKDDHLDHIEDVLKRLVKHNLQVKLSKCKFFTEEVAFLGYVVSSEGIKVNKKKVQAIVNMQPPSTVKELRSFLGMCNYYRKFVEYFSQYNAVLTKLLHKNVDWNFDEDCFVAFNKLKQALTEAPVLASPDFSRQFILTTDACTIGIGGVLSQVFDEGERPILYMSRTLNGAEKNYAVTHLECLAIVWCVKQCQHYLTGQRFIIRTDHHALKWLMSVKDHTGRLMRWALSLMEFNFEVQYVKGKNNVVADALSRTPIPLKMNAVTLIENDSDVLNIDSLVNQRLDEVSDLQQEDLELLPMIQYLTGGILPEEGTAQYSLVHSSREYLLESGVLYHLWQQTKSQPRMEMVKQLVIPRLLRNEILTTCHSDLLAGHYGVKRTYERVRERFYWNGMFKDCDEFVKSCSECQMKKMPRFTGTTVPTSLTHMNLSHEPGSDWAVDLMGPLPTTENGMKYICIFMDRFTRWPEAFPIPDKKSSTVAKLFLEKIVCRFGAPRTLLSDRGGEFINDISKEICKLLNTRKLNTSGYRPQTNGQVEKFNGTLIATISAYVDEGHKDWNEFVPYALFAYRTCRNEFTKETPFYLMFHREGKLPIDRVFKHDEVWMNKEQCILEMVKRMREAKRCYENQVSIAIEEKKRMNDAIRNKKEFKLGQEVLLFKSRHKLGTSKKLTKPWTGPWVVSKRFTNGINYLVKLKKDGTRKQVAHAGNMKTYHSSEMTSLAWSVNPPEEFEENKFYVVEEIRAKRLNVDGETEYFVKWKDYGEEDCTWEPIESLVNSTEALDLFQKKNDNSDLAETIEEEEEKQQEHRRSKRLRK